MPIKPQFDALPAKGYADNRQAKAQSSQDVAQRREESAEDQPDDVAD
ncbi:MAG: hypothetical protein Q6M54_02225 [Thermostichus sp. DRC_bins_24]